MLMERYWRNSRLLSLRMLLRKSNFKKQCSSRFGPWNETQHKSLAQERSEIGINIMFALFVVRNASPHKIQRTCIPH